MTAPSISSPRLAPARIGSRSALAPFLKWPGGKTRELSTIAAAAPELTARFVDPFVGGGSVLLAVPEDVAAVVNDACADLIGLYSLAAGRDGEFRSAVVGLASAWDRLAGLTDLYEALARSFESRSEPEAFLAIDACALAVRQLLDGGGPRLTSLFLDGLRREVVAKFGRIRAVEIRVGRTLSRRDLLANIEGAVRSSVYMAVRSRYNAARLAGQSDVYRLTDFFFLREYTYAALFRFNAKNEFNVPYGGISYNRKSLGIKAAALFGEPIQARLSNTEFYCQDFEPFMTDAQLGCDDFVFVDPPYDSDFSDYDNRTFDGADHRRLQSILAECPSRVMVVIKDTPAIRSLYNPDRWHIVEADKTYLWTIKSRNDRSATHLTITNYTPGVG